MCLKTFCIHMFLTSWSGTLTNDYMVDLGFEDDVCKVSSIETNKKICHFHMIFATKLNDRMVST